MLAPMVDLDNDNEPMLLTSDDPPVRAWPAAARLALPLCLACSLALFAARDGKLLPGPPPAPRGAHVCILIRSLDLTVLIALRAQDMPPKKAKQGQRDRRKREREEAEDVVLELNDEPVRP